MDIISLLGDILGAVNAVEDAVLETEGSVSSVEEKLEEIKKEIRYLK